MIFLNLPITLIVTATTTCNPNLQCVSFKFIRRLASSTVFSTTSSSNLSLYLAAATTILFNLDGPTIVISLPLTYKPTFRVASFLSLE